MKSEFPILGLSAKLALFGFAVLAFFIYLPAFVTTFGIHNDYCYLGHSTTESWLGYPETLHLMALGRPVGAVLLNVHGFFLHSLGSFAIARLVSLVVTLGSAWLAFRYLTEMVRVDRVLGAAIGFCLVLMPGSQLYIMWLTNLVPGALNVLLALLCYLVLDKIDLSELWRGHMRPLRLAVGAMGVFFLTLCIYPPTALTFLALTFANTLLSPLRDWPRVRLQVIRDLLFAGTGMVLYFLVNKFILLPLFSAIGSNAYRETVANITQRGTYRFEIGTNLSDKLGEFVYISTIAIGGELHAIIGDMSAWIMAGLTLAAVVFVAIRAAQVLGAAGNQAWIAQRSALGVLIILCASSPSLAAEQGDVGYRVLTTYQFIAVLCLFAPLHWLSRIAPAFPVRASALALALLSGWLAAWNISDVARNANRELLFIREKLVSAEKDKLATIIGVSRLREVSNIERPLQLEFAYPIGHVSHFAGAIEGLLPAVGLGDRQLTYTFDQGRQKVTYRQPGSVAADLPPLVVQGPGDGLMITDEQTLVIDLYDVSVFGPRRVVHFFSIRTSNGSGGRALFDPASMDDWQPGPAPQWVKLTLPDRTPPKIITLCAGADAEAAAAMPKDCHIMSSENGIDWVEVGLIRGQDKWNAGEERTFAFARPLKAKHFLFFFTAGNGPILKLYKIKL